MYSLGKKNFLNIKVKNLIEIVKRTVKIVKLLNCSCQLN